ncbi:hypothetical protein HDU93_004595 [Gonapodya sp. JEL0774]|nr:hypothetical protein HDU93_004595 [Gonapodya sp. JEL0774]
MATVSVNKTHNRGIAQTGTDGVVQFHTNFPGHYTGRATHIHLLSHTSSSVFQNGTTVTINANATHVGQLFFDQSLITAVDAISPYSGNSQSVTLNSADSILSESTANGFDPIVTYVLLGSTLADGVLAWVTVGIDTSASSTVSPAYVYDSVTGGTANSASGGNGGASGGMGGGQGGPGSAGPAASASASVGTTAKTSSTTALKSSTTVATTAATTTATLSGAAAAAATQTGTKTGGVVGLRSGVAGAVAAVAMGLAMAL